MRNKEIYERIADTYLGKNKKNGKAKKKKWFIFWTVINILLLFTVFFLPKFVLSKAIKSKAAVYILSERYPLRLVYDLRPPNLGKKDFSFSLPLADARKYRCLRLRMKGEGAANFTNILKLELENTRGEKAAYYLKGILSKWQDFSVSLSNFKGISDWSNIARLSFIFEDWNVSAKKGILYIDNIRFSE